jgi:limonene-1,2-epoxide hydrolase
MEGVSMNDNAGLVREFCVLMAKRDAEAARRYLASNAVYQNTGMPATHGVDSIVENLAGQMAMFPDSYEYRLVNLVGEGEVVLTERQDMIRDGNGSLHAVPVMGTFVLSNGKITRWTDYWDTALVPKMMTGEDYAALVPQT